MASTNKIKSNSITMPAKKKSTWPTTESGKNVSSKNSVIHGATSQKLLNDAEHQRYITLLADLKEAYPNQNPLVRMQLERIVKLNIQLERIQNTIYAQFQMSRATSSIYDTLIKTLDIDQKTASLIADGIFGMSSHDEFLEEFQFEVSMELRSLYPPNRPTNHQEFLDKTPTLCQYLHHEAGKQKLSVKDYIDQKIPRLKEDNPSHFAPGLNVRFIFLHERPIVSEQTLDEAIRQVDLSELKRAAEWYSNEISRFIRRNQKVSDFAKLLEIKEFSTTPDLDQLDRLMRYQTTLQRQLSTAIGELLALTKN
jgi:hypothetical protein